MCRDVEGGEVPLSQRWKWVLAQLNEAPGNDLHHQFPVLGRKGIHSFLKHDTQTEIPSGRGMRRYNVKERQSVS